MVKLVQVYRLYRTLDDDEQEMFRELTAVAGKVNKKSTGGKKRGKMSAATKKKIAAAAKARWAEKKKGAKS